ncbi:MAG: hypothetical protein MZV63_09320 [Marinilabiliales bacterium]|nr:hypothetical protein [Marinilabiliales bacterium]
MEVAKTIINSLQTNGTFLDANWCKFFHNNNFLIGLSIDGPKDIHDAYRVNKAGKGSFDKAMAAVSLMKQYGVDYNTLSVVTNLSEGRGTGGLQFPEINWQQIHAVSPGRRTRCC